MGKAFGTLVLLGLVVFGVWYVISHYHGASNFGCRAALPAGQHTVALAEDGCPTSAENAATDRAWAAQQLQRPELAQRPDRKTVGIFYDQDGTQSDPILSGLDAVSDQAEQILKDAGVAMPPHGRYAAIADVETKVAVQMRVSGVKYGVLIINNPKGICEGSPRGDYSCTRAVPAILPVGDTLAVWWPGTDTATILTGKGRA